MLQGVPPNSQRTWGEHGVLAVYPLHKPTFFQAGQASGKSRGWIQGDSDACGAGCSSGGGTVMGPISRASSIGSRRTRVVVQ